MANDMNRNLENLTMMSVPGDKITWRHMESNADGLYGREGLRYFAIKLDDDEAAELEELGWPLVWRNVNRDENEPELMKAFLKVWIKYGTRFPIDIFLVNVKNNTKTLLDESDLDSLHIDTKTIDSIDLMLRPYYWTYRDQHGIKAQVQAMNIRLSQSGLDDGYEIIYKD